MSRPSKDAWAMELARVTAKRATCLRRSVGCVLLDARGHLLATGYNGVASGRPHCNEVSGNGFVFSEDLQLTPEAALSIMLKDMPHVNREQITYFHIEPYQPGRSTLRFGWAQHTCPGQHLSSRYAPTACQAIHAEQNALLQCRDVYAIDTCYTTTAPCITCLKLLLNTSCRRIVFDEPYVQSEAQVWWEGTGRIWKQYQAVL